MLQGNVIVATRADGPPAVESVKTPCSECDEDCWVSRGTRAGAPADAVVVCDVCVLKILKEASGP